MEIHPLYGPATYTLTYAKRARFNRFHAAFDTPFLATFPAGIPPAL